MAPSRTSPAVGRLAKAAGGALAAAGAKLAAEHGPELILAAEAAPVPPAQIPRARATVLLRAYQRAKKRSDAAKEALDEAKAAIVEEMGAADVLQVAETGRPVAELRTITSLVFDATRYREEHPTEVADYMKPQPSRRFRVLS